VAGDVWRGAADGTDERPVRRGVKEILALALLLLFLLFEDAGLSGFGSPVVNQAAVATLIVVLGLGARRALQVEALAVWTPLFWFRIACAVYFGVGALAPYIGNAATLVYMQEMYFFTDGEILKANAINVLGIACVLLAARLLDEGRCAVSARPTLSPGVLAALYLALGGLVRYGIVVPYLMGFGGVPLPSIVSMVTKVYSAGLMLLLVIALRSRAWLLPVAIGLIVVELLAGVLLFNKADVLVTMLFVALALYQHRPSPARLIAGGAATLAVFVSIAPLTGYGRARTAELGAGEQIASAEQRWQIVAAYISGDRLADRGEGVQDALNRLSYVNAETLVVSLYDHGQPQRSLRDIVAVFVPRFVWPGKPDLTEPGRALYMIATGQEGTSISAGLFAEAYGNLGWIGVATLMPPVGIVLAGLGRAAVRVVRGERWIFLPAVLMGLHVGTRVDGHYVTDYVGAPLTVAIVYAGLRLVELLAVRGEDALT
jgi:hypothetical protein